MFSHVKGLCQTHLSFSEFYLNKIKNIFKKASTKLLNYVGESEG